MNNRPQGNAGRFRSWRRSSSPSRCCARLRAAGAPTRAARRAGRRRRFRGRRAGAPGAHRRVVRRDRARRSSRRGALRARPGRVRRARPRCRRASTRGDHGERGKPDRRPAAHDDCRPSATVRDVRPLDPDDPRGTTLNLMLLPLIVVGLPAAVLLAHLGLRAVGILGATMLFALGGGLLVTALVARALGVLPGPLLALAGAQAGTSRGTNTGRGGKLTSTPTSVGPGSRNQLPAVGVDRSPGRRARSGPSPTTSARPSGSRAASATCAGPPRSSGTERVMSSTDYPCTWGTPPGEPLPRRAVVPRRHTVQ